MPKWLHRTTKEYLRSVASADLPESIANYIEEPDFSAITGFPSRYWTITGDVISLMSQAERDAVDVAQLSARRDSLANEIDQVETYARAFALLVLDEFNACANKINELLDAMDAATSLADLKARVGSIADRPIRTAAQLKTALRNRLDT